MVIEGLRSKGENEVRDYRNFMSLVTIAIGTSIDALAVGISFALLNIQIWELGIIIGIVTFLASMTAIRIGKAASARLGQKFEIIGGVILIAIGIRIFVGAYAGNVRNFSIYQAYSFTGNFFTKDLMR